MALYGAERLISARGSYLTVLGMTMPLSDGSKEFAKGVYLPLEQFTTWFLTKLLATRNIGGGFDLSSCTQLRHLVFQFTPAFSANKQSAVRLFRNMLNSWRPQHRSRLEFSAYDYPRSTRREFGNVLRTIGPITDAWVRGVSPAGDTKERHLKHLVICIHD